MNFKFNIMPTLIFDYDDTLVQTKKSVWKTFREIGKRYYDMDITDDMIRSAWGVPYPDLLNEVFQNVDSIENMDRIYRENRSNNLIEHFEDALNFMNNLDEEVFTGIITASNREFVMKDLTRLGFPMHKFKYIQTSEDTQFHKPDPRVFDKLKSLEDIDIKDVIYIGDSKSDFLSSTGAGIKFVGIARDDESRRMFEELGAEYISSFGELDQKVKTQRSKVKNTG